MAVGVSKAVLTSLGVRAENCARLKFSFLLVALRMSRASTPMSSPSRS